jgi:hypothetical protein
LQGVLAKAKNGDKLFWEEKFHAAKGKAQACTQGALLFLLPQANRCACVDFGCTHPIDGLFFKSTHLLVGFLLKI